MRSPEYAIVGAGPVGLVLSLLLANQNKSLHLLFFLCKGVYANEKGLICSVEDDNITIELIQSKKKLPFSPKNI